MCCFNDLVVISIVVITYNSSKYVLETLESIKDQTYPNLELIVSDDCSTDDTVKLCTEWIENNKERFVRTQIIVSNENMGVAANCNRAEDACQGEWVKIIAGDDLLLPNCIQDYMDVVSKNKDAVYVFGKIQVFGGDEHLRTMFLESVFDYSFFHLTIEQQLERLLYKGNCIPAASSFYNVVKTRELGLRYDERIPLLEDLPRWINALRKNIRFYFFDKETVMYRVGQAEALTASGNGFSNIRFYKSSRLYEMYYVFDSLLENNKNDAYQNIVDYEVKERNKLIEYHDKYYSVLNSHAFRIGTILLQPIYWVKRLLGK